MNYYNEWEKFPAQWLRELAADGLIPEGVVDERSIAELRHEDLAGFNQCHFFAGIGGWPLALRLAGWPEEWPIWTGSCPCQPFSNAGKRKGDSDERHLWPVWFELIRVRKPAAVVGEQVASAIAMGWLDRVLDDLESEGYETWACVLPACSVGAPHLRARLFWAGVRVGDSQQPRLEGHAGDGADWDEPGRIGAGAPGSTPATGHWSDAAPILCRDGKTRRIPAPQPGLQRLAHGLPEGMDLGWAESAFPLAGKVEGRVGLLKGYGNAIVPQVAAAFLREIFDIVGVAP